jgi:hypothetical protein
MDAEATAMTRASPARIARRRGRPKGSTVPFERDRQRFAIAAWWGFRECGCGPYGATYWATVATGDEPIRPEDIGGLLTVAGIDIKRTASSLDKHLDALTRKAKRAPADNVWLQTSATTIKALILAARTNNMRIYCDMLDVLIGLGWADVIERLSARIIEASKSNVPPHEGKLGRRAQQLLAGLRDATPKKP